MISKVVNSTFSFEKFDDSKVDDPSRELCVADSVAEYLP